jgi:hypothetical protein
MDTLYLLSGFINDIFIKGLFISVLSIMIVGRILKADTRNAFVIIRWMILVHAVLSIVYYYMLSFAAAITISFYERSMALNNLAYYLMLIPNTLLPLLLLFKKLGRNQYVLLALSLLMNIGWMLEWYIIYDTELHNKHNHYEPSLNVLWFFALKGVFIGAVIYAIGRAVTRKRADIPAT